MKSPKEIPEEPYFGTSGFRPARIGCKRFYNDPKPLVLELLRAEALRVADFNRRERP
jgi:hypothetical protein